MVALHPTILIGFGEYGRRLLRQFLTQAHDRGVLQWEDPPQAEASAARRLKNLALIVVNSPSGNDPNDEGITKDLCSQIQGLPAPSNECFSAAVELAKRRLLDAPGRVAGAQNLRLGLDVIALAQPNELAVLGNIERLLHPVMDSLSKDRSLQSPAPGADLLNVILMLDFDRYWDPSPAGETFRTQFGKTVQQWEKRRHKGGTPFSRIYLMDRETEDGNRDEAVRSEELVLLLLFMLFEGVRDNVKLRSLYQRENDSIQPLCSFGIRVVERNPGLLARLAAAKFAWDWLQHLASGPATLESRSWLRTQLEYCRLQQQNFSQVRKELRSRVSEKLDELESELGGVTASSAGAEDWAARVRNRMEEVFGELRSSLMNFAGDQARQLSREYLHRGEDLQTIVGQALNGPRAYATEPLPLSAVIEELENLSDHLKSVATHEVNAVGAAQYPYQSLERVHRSFRDWLSVQADSAQLKLWWPKAALLFAAAWTPILMDALGNVSPPDPGSGLLWRHAYSALGLVSAPWLLASVLLALAWLAGGIFFQRQIERWQQRALSFFIHPNQGMLVDRVRELVRSSPLRESLDQFVDEIYRGLVRQVSDELQAAILAIRDRLKHRQREATWLRNQMREFLRAHGIDPAAEELGKRALHASSVYSISMEHERDLQTVLSRNPPGLERFRSMQAELRPFDQWNKKYCDDFLYPIRFLEQLSRDYEFETVPETGASAYGNKSGKLQEKQFSKFLERFAGFHVAFHWGAEPGAAVNTESFCVLPAPWRNLPEIQTGLSSYAFTENRIISGVSNDRLHLLRIEQGVSPSRLAEGGGTDFSSQEADRS